MTPPQSDATRRDFLKQLASTTATLAALAPLTSCTQPTATSDKAPLNAQLPWHQRTFRWGQTNITEADCATYDIPWWRQYWQRTSTQGVIINAGGIVAYYPSKFPLHYRPPQLANRDLFGELTKAAHDDGLIVIARMDSSKAFAPLYNAHPDWFSIDAAGQPYRYGEFYLSCVNSPYYDDYLPDIMREIIDRSHPDGFADNIWHGLDRVDICYCKNCSTKFLALTGKPIPQQKNWNDPIYRKWIDWNYARRLELWDNNNKVTQTAGGKDCLWIGMNGSGVSGQASSFRDIKGIAERSQMVLLDSQSRTNPTGFQENAFNGKLIHGVLGWDKIVPESMAMYQHGSPQFRLSAKPVHEVQQWMLSGIAGGITPWWHHVGAYDEDRRPYQTAEAVGRFHKLNQEYLTHRTPIATVGIVWSQRNNDFFGRDSAGELCDQPAQGFTQAMIRARIPFVPIHIDHIERESKNLSVLILPNLGAISDSQLASIRKFVANGGSLIATGQTSQYDENGDPRPDFALADLFGVSSGKPATLPANSTRIRTGPATATARHSYLRLTPELRANSYGPKTGKEPAPTGQRHPILAGFDATDILPFGGTLQPLTVNSIAQTLLTFIPEFPTTPPEISWMPTPSTHVPALIINESNPGRVVYLPADLDRLYANFNLPDHGDLLANIIRWAAKDDLPLQITGPGLLNCELYQQPNRIILHLLNLTSAATWRAPLEQLIPVGPLQITLKLPKDFVPKSHKHLVANESNSPPLTLTPGYAHLTLPSLLGHEVIVLEA